jgi:hypothetical protein
VNYILLFLFIVGFLGGGFWLLLLMAESVAGAAGNRERAEYEHSPFEASGGVDGHAQKETQLHVGADSGGDVSPWLAPRQKSASATAGIKPGPLASSPSDAERGPACALAEPSLAAPASQPFGKA